MSEAEDYEWRTLDANGNEHWWPTREAAEEHSARNWEWVRKSLRVQRRTVEQWEDV